MSSRTLRIIMIVITVIAIGLTTYLTYIHYAGLKPVCTAGESCTKVQTSIYSKIVGVPVALLGLVGYILILAALLAPQRESTLLILVVLCMGGFAFSCYLTYRELFSIHAICEECVSSAAMVTLLMIGSVWRFLLGADPPVEPSDATNESVTSVDVVSEAD